MKHSTILGIDMGGTQIRAGVVRNGILSTTSSKKFPAQGSSEEVLEELFNHIAPSINGSVTAIGIGVPGLVDPADSMVTDVVNIPSWKTIPLQKLMEERYGLPVRINNDSNCFALGEFHFGKGKGRDSMIGLTIGTGLGTGIIINNKLYSGKHGAAGEFGMADYLDKYFEYYASGQFFQYAYETDGEQVFQNAREGDTSALKMYGEMGIHLGNAIKTILYAYDIDLFVLGGSVSQAFDYFSPTMWRQIQTFPYKKVVEGLQIEVSELENSGILGAAALYYDL